MQQLALGHDQNQYTVHELKKYVGSTYGLLRLCPRSAFNPNIEKSGLYIIRRRLCTSALYDCHCARGLRQIGLVSDVRGVPTDHENSIVFNQPEQKK